MSKMNELSQTLDALLSCAQGLVCAVDALREVLASAPDPSPQPVPEAKPTPTYTFADVRRAFSAKSHEGFTDQVRELIRRYGAEKLSSVKEADYPALMAELEAIG